MRIISNKEVDTEVKSVVKNTVYILYSTFLIAIKHKVKAFSYKKFHIS